MGLLSGGQVAFISILDTAQTVIVMCIVWHYAISGWGKIEALNSTSLYVYAVSCLQLAYRS
jgi:hypothetical protein